MKVKAKDLAKAAGIGPPAISNEVKRGNLIRDEKRFFDLENPINDIWIKSRGITPSKFNIGTKSENKLQTEKKSNQSQNKNSKKKIPDNFSEPESEKEFDFESLTGLPERMQNLTLRQLALRYGAQMQLKGWVDILNTIMSAQKKDVDIQEKRKELVPRRFVEYLKNYINTYNNRLFDYADGCVSEIISLVIADSDKAKIKIPTLLRKNFSKYAEETIRQIDKEIKNLKVNEDADADN